MPRYKRIIASILLVAALMTLMPPVTAVEEGAIRVITGTEVSVSLAGSTLVQVETELTETLRWQIYSPEYEVWADISGKTGTSCEVSYAMICNALDNAGIAKLRCAAGEAVSPTVTVRVDYDAQYVFAASVMLSDADEPTEAVEDTEPATVSEDTEIIGVDDCIVEVQFLYYSTKQSAAASWTARVSTGSSHALEVTLPKVIGYAPFYQGHKITSEKLTITTDVLEGDTTYVVYFQAADVQYTVVHHQQNVDNDNYIPVLTETLMGPTDSLVGMVEKNYAGFTALLYEHPAIAADGSTVVDIYYDREYYLMNFILGEGGYGVYPLFARYDAAVDVGTPVRAGYTFQGWEPALPATVPAQNTSYTALWKVNDKAQVTIVIWGENPNDEHYAYLGSQVISAVPGTILTYTSYGLMTCGKQEHVHNENCVLLCDKVAHVHSAVCCTRDEHTSNADCCTVPEHDHVVACWGNLAGEQANPSNAPDDAQQGQIYRRWSWSDGYVYYIYIGESWYVYNGTPSGNLVHSSCGMAEHTHGDGGCSCEDVHTHGDGACVYCKQDLVEHIHVDDCYDTSDLDAHVHIDSCYEDILSSYVDSTLYYYVHSEQITVEAD